MEKIFDLEERTKQFSKNLIITFRKLPKNAVTVSMLGQGIRSGTAIGANYLEANDALGKKDFIMRNKIARKEAKETLYWLELLIEACPEFVSDLKILHKECIELKNILSAIIKKASV